MSGKIQNLLEQANYSETNDSSVTFAKRVFLTESETQRYFNKVRQELFDLEIWDKNSTPSSYEMFDENGNVCAGKIIVLDRFIRINVPGSGKFDWVKVIEIHDAPNEFVIRVQPIYDPTEKPVDKTVTSHFFHGDATNNFCLQKDGKEIILYVIGLNEKVNTKETDNTIETVRNLATANLGYYLGIQKVMWKDFCMNFLEIEK